jgi:Fe2+ transport system protein B
MSYDEYGAERDPYTAAPVQNRDIESLLRDLIDLVSTAKPMPLSGSVLISREEVLDLLDEVIASVPEEVRQARWLLREKEEFLAGQRREADALMEQVKQHAERMVSRTELVRMAQETADRIVEDARESSRRLRNEADDYCDQKLAGMEIVLNRVLKTVEAGRDKLKPALDPAMAPDIELGDEQEGADFFDQDER